MSAAELAAPAASAAPADAAQLLAVPGQIVPFGAEAGHVETPDGVRLRTARFAPATRPARGTVMLVGGRAEAVEKYYETVRALQERGFHVVSFDWRGQGLSERIARDPALGHVETFDDYVIDLETVLTRMVLPDCRPPFFLLAHSMGGLVALLAGPRITGRFKRMVLLTPLLAFGSSLPLPQRWIARVAAAATFLGLGRLHATARRKVTTWPFMGNVLTSDPQRHARWQAMIEARPQLSLGGPSFGWLHAACRAMEEVRDPARMAAQTVPTLIVSAGADRLVDSDVVEAYAHALRTGAHLPVRGARHEILLERDVIREPFWAAFDAFVPGSGPF